MTTQRTYTIHTDGSCSNNGGPFAQAGWGAILRNPEGLIRELAGPVPSDQQQTNSRAELMAIVQAVRILKNPAIVNFFTDSNYIAESFSQYLDGWISKLWRTSSGKPVAHADLWQEIDRLRKLHQLNVIWIKAHVGHPYNEAADRLANAGRTGKRLDRRIKPAPTTDSQGLTVSQPLGQCSVASPAPAPYG